MYNTMFQFGSLIALGGGAYVRLRMLEKHLDDTEKRLANQVDAIRTEHDGLHEIRADIKVINARLEGLSDLLQKVVTPIVRASALTPGGQD